MIRIRTRRRSLLLYNLFFRRSRFIIKNIINSILPEKLSSYFLFDGERIKNLGENTAQARKDISTGIKNILNIDVYDSLKSILERKVMNLLQSQLKSEASEELEKKKTKRQNQKENNIRTDS